MAGALLAELHLQAVGEKGEQIVGLLQVGMRLHERWTGEPPLTLRHQHFELHRQFDISRAQFDDLVLQGMQRLNRLAQFFIAAHSTEGSGKRNSFSITMRITPSAARRSAKGSLEPVGFSPIDQKPTNVSILSASATAIATGSAGTRSSGPCGR